MRDHLRRKHPGFLELDSLNIQAESQRNEDEPVQDQHNNNPQHRLNFKIDRFHPHLHHPIISKNDLGKRNCL